ncbi:glycosyltransferase family 2 protein [Candidatus Roizmanbacteria bacterium]|nr:glycosyltransferase family 2 protein [Candidatus Roizmanbacteria bacterium]
MAKPDLSIIIVSHNTKKITQNCLESIIKSVKNLSCQVIVVDNGSKDGTSENIKYQISNIKTTYQKSNISIKLHENTHNLGFGKANNQGLKLAQSDYILFLNSDIVVLDNSIEKLYDFYRNNEKKMQFLGGKLLNQDMTPQPSCGPAYSLPMVAAHLFLRGDYWGLTRYSPDSLKQVDWVSGACILTKKEYLEKIGGFDENIFMYMDEIDLLHRAKKQGYHIFFYPEAKFIHLGSASSSSRKYPIIHVFNGLIYFYNKHHSKLDQFLLKIMLKLKASIGLILGYIFNNSYLKETYAKAFKLVKLV